MKSTNRKLEHLSGGILSWLRRERDKSLAVRELNRISDHLLRDIGIERGEIREVVNALFAAGDRAVTRDVSSLGRAPSHEATQESSAGPCEAAV